MSDIQLDVQLIVQPDVHPFVQPDVQNVQIVRTADVDWPVHPAAIVQYLIPIQRIAPLGDVVQEQVQAHPAVSDVQPEL